MAWEKLSMNKPIIQKDEYYMSLYHGTKNGCLTGVRASFSATVSKIIMANNFKKYEIMIDKEAYKVGIQFLTEESNGARIIISQNTTSANATPRTTFSFTKEWKYIINTLDINDFEQPVKFQLIKERDDFFIFDCSELKKNND